MDVPQDFQSAIAAAVRHGARPLVLQQIFYPESRTLAGLALQFRLPAMGWRKPFAEVGGLMAFGALPEDNYRRLAKYVDRLLGPRRAGRRSCWPAPTR